MTNHCYAKLHVLSFGLALGIVWGVSIFVIGLIAMTTDWGGGFVETMHTVYIGYEPTILGSIIGGIWGFVDLFIGGMIIAAIYNGFLCCCRRNKGMCDTKDEQNKPKP